MGPTRLPSKTGADLRARLVIVHRWLGLAMAGFLVMAGLTGSITAFQAELDAWLNPQLFVVQGDETPLALGDLVSRVEKTLPAIEISSIDLASDRRNTIKMFVAPRDAATSIPYDQIFVDPASARILGHRQWGAVAFDALHFAPMIYNLHYSLLLPGNIGKTILGSVALAWMLDCTVGFYLTLPRATPFWRKWRKAWQVKRKASGYRRTFDIHRAAGLWLWPVLFLMAFTGMALSLERQIFRPVLSALLPTTPSDPPTSATKVKGPKPDFAEALERARIAAGLAGHPPATWTRIAIAPAGYLVHFDRLEKAGLHAMDVTIGVDAVGTSHTHVAGSGKTGDVIADLRLPMHSGRVGGLCGRLLVSATGLIVALLSITGVAIWWRKRANRNHRPSLISFVGPDTAE